MKKAKVARIIVAVCLILAGGIILWKCLSNDEMNMVMGGAFCVQEDKECKENNPIETGEKFYRPSNLPILNNTIDQNFFDVYHGKSLIDIVLPTQSIDTAKNTVLNYFSVLREAANPIDGKSAGCGSIGSGKNPYPVAYQFLSPEYQEELTFEEYKKSFENILHTSLIKYHEVPVNSNKENEVRYFVELEIIEGTERNQGVFAYYYGFVDLVRGEIGYHISNLNFFGENYLCAPYHGWFWDAEANTQIRYGDWCQMIKVMGKVQQEGYIKRVPFIGNDGHEYCIVFFELTNGTDTEIAQFRRKDSGEWGYYPIIPEDCIEDK